MRPLILSFLFSASLVASAHGQAATIGETNVSRPGGAYTSTPAPNASACASLCAGDGLCMAWDYAVGPQTCELKAVTPAPRAATGFVSGLSARAPAFARAMSNPTPPAPPPAALAASTNASPLPAAHAAEPATEGLLGGPEPAPASDLRPTIRP